MTNIIFFCLFPLPHELHPYPSVTHTTQADVLPSSTPQVPSLSSGRPPTNPYSLALFPIPSMVPGAYHTLSH